MGSCLSNDKKTMQIKGYKQAQHPIPLEKPQPKAQVIDNFGILYFPTQHSIKFFHAPLRYCQFLFSKFKKSDSTPQQVSLGFMLSKCNINIQKKQMDIWCINSSVMKVWVVYGGVQKVSQTGLTVQITGYKHVQEILVQEKSTNSNQGDHLQTIQLKQHPHQSIIVILQPLLDGTQTLFMLYRYQIIPHQKQYSLITQTLQWNSLSFRISDIYGSQYLFKCDDENQTCSICLTSRSQCILLPCRHMCLCGVCLEQVEKTKPICPLCRKEYYSVVKYQKAKGGTEEISSQSI